MKHNNWTDDMRRRLANREVQVPDELWSKIEQRIDMPKRPNRHIVPLLAWVAVAAAVLGVVVVVYRDGGSHDTCGKLQRAGSPCVAGTVASSKMPSPDASLVERVVATVEKRVLSKDTETEEKQPHYGLLADNLQTQASSDFNAQVVAAPDEDDVERGSSSDKGSLKEKYSKPAHSRENTLIASYSDRGEKKRSSDAGWSVGVHTGGVIVDNGSMGYPGMYAMKSPLFVDNGSPDNGAVGYMSTVYQALLPKYKEVKHHSLPVSFGISVGYSLTGRLQLTTGLVYTRAVTDFVSSSGNDNIKSTQRLHYIGVPLGVKYTVWGNSRLQTYATAGAQADFNVSSKMTAGETTTNIDHDRTQFSVGAAAGVQLMVVPKVGVFAEPGIRYYIDNKSNVETIFKDKPWTFSVHIGLRADL